MSYAFDRIMGVMGRQRQDDKPKIEMGGGRQAPGASQANTMGRPMEAQSNPYGQPAAGQAPAPQGPDRVRAATTEGSLPQGGAPGGAAPQPSAPQAQQTPASRGRIFQANAGRVGSPVDLSAMGQQIASAKGKIKETADGYVKNAGSFYSNQLPGYVKDSIQGYAGLSPNAAEVQPLAASTPAGGLGQEPIPMPSSGNDNTGDWRNINDPVSDASWVDAYTQGPGQVAEFSLPFQTNISNADMIDTDAGLGELFRRGGGAEYSAGDAAFDTALLRKNAAFNALRDQTLSDNRDLEKLELTIGGDAKKRAQEALDTSYGGWKNAVTGELEGAAKALEGRGGEREGAFDANIMSQREKDKKKGGGAAKKQIDQLIADNPDLAFQIQTVADEGYDPTAYMNVSGLTDDKTSWTDFLADTEAKGFNNVMTLLGKGGPAVGKGQYYGANYGDYVNSEFDSAGFTDYILNEAAKKPKLVIEQGKVDAKPTPPAGGQTSAGGSGPPYQGEKGNDTSFPPWVSPTPILPHDMPYAPIIDPLRPVPIIGQMAEGFDTVNSVLNEKEDKATGYVKDRIPKKKPKLPGGKFS